MNTFIKEFRENISYIADELTISLESRREEKTTEYEIIEKCLEDWINEYQNTVNDLEEDTSEEFYNNQL